MVVVQLGGGGRAAGRRFLVRAAAGGREVPSLGRVGCCAVAFLRIDGAADQGAVGVAHNLRDIDLAADELEGGAAVREALLAVGREVDCALVPRSVAEGGGDGGGEEALVGAVGGAGVGEFGGGLDAEPRQPEGGAGPNLVEGRPIQALHELLDDLHARRGRPGDEQQQHAQELHPPSRQFWRAAAKTLKN
eukprot:CAMPEP_0118895716 /NCGR_PEP_ID=MMETSP1166-20130328/3940_1 /TAXON_ID=1104430 /ORGANISM="Chrysoreinhardia sp, Strain CCMP3193" /LENGTH=190 /DNA_ID=CAMNT_0006834763 /DNA_START=52 /DNA_END=624 /DNA_ORIENTATION=-